jgi:integrase
MIRRPKHNKSRERRLSVEEESRLMLELETKTRNPWMRPIVIFAIETGMRRSEILSLTWEYVDLQRRVARLVDTKNGEGRSVPLTLKATSLLLSMPRSIDGRVFATTAEAVKLSFQRAVVRSQIDDLHFHDLRHEAVSRLFEKGLNVMEVSSVSGHKTLQMLKRYTHLSSDILLSKIG